LLRISPLPSGFAMAALRLLVVLALFVAASAQNGECEESSLGFACMKSLAEFYNLHWTLFEDSVDMALEGVGAEWVGFSFAEEEGMMAPADAVIGWTEGSDFSVEPYRITIQAVTADDLDEDVTLSSSSVTQDNERTIVSFTRSLMDGTVMIDPEAETLVNYAIGDMDSLVYHGPENRGQSSITLSLGMGDANGNVTDLAAEGPEAEEPAAEPLDDLM